MNRDSFFAYVNGLSKGALLFSGLEAVRVCWPDKTLLLLIPLSAVILVSLLQGINYWNGKHKFQRAGCEREKRSLGGYQPCARNCTDKIVPPPKNR